MAEQQKQVRIFSVGSCDSQTRKGYCEASITVDGKATYLKRDLEDTTANRCIIHGMIDALATLKTPSRVTLTSSTKIGTANKNRGPNADLIAELRGLLTQGDHHAEYEVQEGNGQRLREIIRTAEGFDRNLLPASARGAYEDDYSISQRLDSQKARKPFVYVITPIDFGWDHLPTVDDTLKMIKRDEDRHKEGHEDYDLAYESGKFSKDWDEALSAAQAMGMSSDLRQDPSVLWLPDELMMRYSFVFKEDGNGTTYVVSHIEMPWLNHISMTQSLIDSRQTGLKGTFKQVKWAETIVEASLKSFQLVAAQIPELKGVCDRLAELLQMQRESHWVIANREVLKLRLLKSKKGDGFEVHKRGMSQNPLVGRLDGELLKVASQFFD